MQLDNVVKPYSNDVDQTSQTQSTLIPGNHKPDPNHHKKYKHGHPAKRPWMPQQVNTFIHYKGRNNQQQHHRPPNTQLTHLKKTP
jgi:hypothetical protein